MWKVMDYAADAQLWRLQQQAAHQDAGKLDFFMSASF